MRMKRADIEALERSGVSVSRKAKPQPPAPVEAKPTPAPRPAPAPPPVALGGKEVVAAIHALGDKIAAIAREQPLRKPSPYRFTVTRNPKTGLIESCLAEPLRK